MKARTRSLADIRIVIGAVLTIIGLFLIICSAFLNGPDEMAACRSRRSRRVVSATDGNRSTAGRHANGTDAYEPSRAETDRRLRRRGRSRAEP